MKTLTQLSLRTLLAGLIFGTLLLAPSARATPYASSLTNNAGVISFLLNESADSVKIISNGGATTNDLGALPKGLTVTNLGISTPYSIVVFKNATPGYTQGAANQISSDTNALLRFGGGHGVAVNKDPQSPYFGRIYVANHSTATTTNVVRSPGRGIFALNPDQTDALGFGSTAQTGGLPFGTNAVPQSPYRLNVGQDNNLYIADFSTNVANIYFLNGDLTTNAAGSQLLQGPPAGTFPVNNTNHGSIAGVVVTGYLTNSTLTAFWVDEDLQTNRTSSTMSQINSLWALNIGGTIPNTNMPTRLQTPGIAFTSQTMDVAQGPDGKLYLSNYRSAGSEPIVWIVMPDGTFVTNTLLQTRAFTGNSAATDVLAASQCLDISRDGKYMALLKDNSQLLIVPLINGIPDIGNVQLVNTTNATGGTAAAGDVAFDPGNNICVLSANQTLRIFAPGGPTTATTTSDGTFTYTNVLPQTFISVTATKPDSAETTPQGLNNGIFTFTRTGDVSQPTTAIYTLTGTAINGTDYVTNVLSVTFAPGDTTTNVTIVPIDDAIAEANETVILTLLGGSNYFRIAPISATVNISDNDTPSISISSPDAVTYERVARDVMVYRFTRIGATNVAVTVNLTFSGTAVNGTDYGITNGLTAVPSTFLIPAGATTADLAVSPINDNIVEATETATVTIVAGTGYTIGTAAVSASIVDDDLGPETILFSDNFDTDTSANWTARFGANYGGVDYFAAFNFDYYNNNLDPFNPDLIPTSPRTTNSALTRGLKMTVNKDYDGLFQDASAGVNFYPNGQSFSNNYAVRFSMFLDVGGAATTEHAVFGINHSGNFTNRFTLSTDTNAVLKGGDGVWFSINNDNGAAAVFTAWYTPVQANPPVQITNRTAIATLFPNPPYDIAAGVPGISRLVPDTTNFTWVDVEVSQLGRAITLKLNNTVIFTFNNPSIYTNGNIMLGYADAFDSTGTPDTFVVYDDLRVIAQVPTVSIVSNTPSAEPGTTVSNGVFTISRNAGTNTALTVNYAITGSAVNGTDYQTIPTSVTIPIGAFSTNIIITPLSDNLVETNELVILTLSASANYDLTGSSSVAATNVIKDTLPVAPKINSFSFTSTNTMFLISGGVSDTTNQFFLETSGVVTGGYTADLTAIIQFLSNGSFQIITTNLPTTNRFYRIKR
jgi:hypothetical protein